MVLNLLLMVFGLMAFFRLPLGEYPDLNAPVLTVSTAYAGASAEIIETRVSRVIEDRISGIEGIRTISSTSQEGMSRVAVEFDTARDIEAAANDLRQSLSRIAGELPTGSQAPEITKAGMVLSPILRLNFFSDRMNRMALTDYVQRQIVEKLTVIDGVADVELSGPRHPAMRIWLDPVAIAARRLTVAGIETNLRTQTEEYPAGRIELAERELAVEVRQPFQTVDDFRNMVIGQGDEGHLIRLGEVARVEIAPADERNESRSNQQPSVGIGISKQSQANTLEVARKIKAKLERMRNDLPEGSQLVISMDDSLFIEEAINEVYFTLVISLVLVIAVIYLFLGTWRAVLIPAVTVPVSLTASFILLSAFGYSVNLISLLAIVLSIGLVVDDSIVVLENVQRRVREGETPLVAAYRGTRQVYFAVISTTLVVIAVFVPIIFLGGEVGRMFSELAVTVSAAIAFSSVSALTLTPAMCARLLRNDAGPGWLQARIDAVFGYVRDGYRDTLVQLVKRPVLVAAAVAAVFVATASLMGELPGEYIPKEDRGMFFIFVQAPEGSSLAYTDQAVKELESLVMPLVESGEAVRVGSRIPGWGGSTAVNSAVITISLAPWGERTRTSQQVVAALMPEMRKVAGVTTFPILPTGFSSSGSGSEIEFVIGGSSYEELSRWSKIVLEAAEANPNLRGVDSDYKDKQPQLRLRIDEDRAGALGVPISAIGTTLETMLNSRKVATYTDRGEEYDVILQGEKRARQSPDDLAGIYVRSLTTGELIPLSNLVTQAEVAGTSARYRYNRMRAITISADTAPGYSLGEALEFLEGVAREELPDSASISYRGDTLKFKESGQFLYWSFAFAVLVVFLLLAAQFESFVHPAVIMLTVPLALFGGLLGLYLVDGSLNVYSQIGIVMLIGIAAKNGILIVEFANQLRDEGRPFTQALIDASCTRLRPILMTGASTVLGAMPLVLATGAGANGRFSLGIVIVAGVTFATALTLFVVPVFYHALCRRTQSPGSRAAELEGQLGGSVAGRR